MANSRGVNPIMIQCHLKGMKYPCSKQDLVNKAQQEGAPQAEMEALQKLPDRQYGGPQEVTKELDNVM